VQSPGSFVKALQSLYHKLLIHPTTTTPIETAADSSKGLAFADSSAKEQDFLRNVADELIDFERVVFLVDEEVNGLHPSFSFDYEVDCE
jgi:hypothetical protein